MSFLSGGPLPPPFDLLPVLLAGAGTTLKILALTAPVALVLSVLVGLGRLAPAMSLRAVATVYVEVLRGTSAVVQLFYLFFVLPHLGLRIDAVTTAVLGLSLNVSAYGSEIVRAAVNGVDRGQWEAARALHLSPLDRMRRIVLPQAVPAMLPPFGNLLIELLKATSLVSLVTLTDLTFAGSSLITTTGRAAEIWALVLGLYFLMSLPLSLAVDRLEAWADPAAAGRRRAA